jgi:hypothetical protein
MKDLGCFIQKLGNSLSAVNYSGETSKHLAWLRDGTHPKALEMLTKNGVKRVTFPPFPSDMSRVRAQFALDMLHDPASHITHFDRCIPALDVLNWNFQLDPRPVLTIFYPVCSKAVPMLLAFCL